MKIGDQEMTVREMTAGDLAVITPLVSRLAPLVSPEGADIKGMAGSWNEILGAAEHLLDHNKNHSQVCLRNLPLHLAIEAINELLIEWLAVNGKYVSDQVAPAVSSAAQTVALVANQVKESLVSTEQ